MNPQQNNRPQLPALIGDRNNLQRLLGNDRFQDQLRGIAGKFLTPEKVTRLALLAASRQPLLTKCTQASVLMALMKAAELGLDFAGTTGQGWLIPFKNGHTGQYEVEFWPGVRGYVELAYRSGHVAYVDTQVVRQKDQFRYGLGTTPFVEHTPQLAGDAGPVVCAYAVVLLKESTIPKVELMTFAEIEAIRQRSRAKDNGPWQTDWNEMAKKTVLKRILKDVPLGPKLEDALGLDAEEADPGVPDAELHRRSIPSETVRPDVDPSTGEIFGAAGQAYTDTAEDPNAGSAADDSAQEAPSEDAELSDFPAQKRSLLAQIQDEMSLHYPDGSVASQAARLKLLGHVFGSADPSRIGNLPLEVLNAGLEYLKSQANQETPT